MTYFINPLSHAAESIRRLRQYLGTGTSITITSDSVIAQMGQQRFVLHDQPYELEADLEAFKRLASRRVK
jgi:hypothetical protein